MEDRGGQNTDAESTVYFEDVEVGTTVSCGSVTVSEAELRDYAERFDPLPIHTDPDAAAESRFGGLIASGFHTLSLAARLVAEEIRSERAIVAGMGLDDVRWHAPVRPGDTLSVEYEVLDAHVSESDPSTGIVHELITVRNGEGETVLSFEDYELVERRSDAE